jgi:hypothetical protein
MGLIFNRGAGIEAITGSINNINNTVAEAIEDKDLRNKLQAEIMKTRMQLLNVGPGSSITKITICGLVTVLVFIGCFKFLVQPEDMVHYNDFLLSVTPLIGILIGAYGAGSVFKRMRK